MISSSFWRDRRIFVTGHTGFRGAWLALMLERLNARVTGYALAPKPHSLYDLVGAGEKLCDVRGDVCDAALLDGALRAADPDIVIHLAVHRSNAQCRTGWAMREQAHAAGRVAVLDAVAHASSVQAVLLSSEGPARHDLSGAELCDGEPRIVSITSAHSIGGGDVAGVRSRRDDQQAASQALHTLDSLYGLLLLAQNACEQGEGMNAHWTFARDCNPDDASRNAALGWAPLLSAEEARAWTDDWAQALSTGADMRAVTLDQIDRYLGQRVRLSSPFAAAGHAQPARLRSAAAC